MTTASLQSSPYETLSASFLTRYLLLLILPILVRLRRENRTAGVRDGNISFFLVCNRYIQLYFELGIHHAADLFDCSLLLILTFVCVASSVMLRLSAMCIRIGTTTRPSARYATSASWHLLIALSASDFYKCQSIFCGESAWHFLYFFLLDRAIIAAVAAATSTT